jgi:hypothetical protein
MAQPVTPCAEHLEAAMTVIIRPAMSSVQMCFDLRDGNSFALGAVMVTFVEHIHAALQFSNLWPVPRNFRSFSEVWLVVVCEACCEVCTHIV